MTGHSAKSKKHFYYLCSGKHKQGEDTCHARMLPKDKLERLVIDQLKARVLTDDNLEKMVELVNEELVSAHSVLKDRIDTVDTEINDINARLARLYDSLETGRLDLDDLAPRIKELRTRKEELGRTRMQIEADMVVQGVHRVDASIVKTYARDLHTLLEEAEISERKAFLKSFIKKITVDGDRVTVNYRLPLPDKSKDELALAVLPIDTFGGAEGIRTPYLLNAIQSLSQLSYSPTSLLYTVCARNCHPFYGLLPGFLDKSQRILFNVNHYDITLGELATQHP